MSKCQTVNSKNLVVQVKCKQWDQQGDRTKW